MKFEKPPLTFEQQADLLLSRGLIADKQTLINRLNVVNYYRLTAYLYPFRTASNQFYKGTSLDVVWSHYIFDRQLRMIVMDAIERVEVSIRTQLAYHFSHLYGPFAYAEPDKLSGLTAEEHKRWIDELRLETSRSKEPFIAQFYNRYGDKHDVLPLWMLVEVMSFGKTLTFFRGVDNKLQRMIAELFGVNDEVLRSWLITLNGVRNICAHHGRIWNRELGYQPKIPRERKYPEWHKPVAISREKMFGVLTILRHMLRYAAPTSRWQERLRSLLAEHPQIPLRAMGFPANWDESPLWKIR